MRNRWVEHCDTISKGIKDPYRHGEGSLRSFLDLHYLVCGKCDKYNLSGDNSLSDYCLGCESRPR